MNYTEEFQKEIEAINQKYDKKQKIIERTILVLGITLLLFVIFSLFIITTSIELATK